MEAPTLQTERLVIRPFVTTDIDAFVRELASKPDIMRNLSEACATPTEQLAGKPPERRGNRRCPSADDEHRVRPAKKERHELPVGLAQINVFPAGLRKPRRQLRRHSATPLDRSP